MSPFLPFLKTPPAGDDRQQQAWAKWQAAPNFKRAEHWRWTNLTALAEPARRVEMADYQYALPDELLEDFGADAAADQRVIDLEHGQFAALNVAFLPDALLLTVPDDAEISDIASLNVDMFAAKMQFSRIHIRAGKNSHAGFWLEYNASARGAQIPVLTIDAAENARVDVALWFNGAAETAQAAQVVVREAESSVVNINAAQHSGALQRLDIEARLVGDSAHFAFGGVQCLDGSSVGDYHISIHHQTENSTSNQVLRGALDGHSHGLFYGMIHVDKGALETNAEQDCRYLLLSETAKSSSMPCLLINTADVKCAHGATAGNLDPESLFYLRSRGIPLAEAKNILTLSFLQEAVIVKHEQLQALMAEAITALWLAEDESA